MLAYICERVCEKCARIIYKHIYKRLYPYTYIFCTTKGLKFSDEHRREGVSQRYACVPHKVLSGKPRAPRDSFYKVRKTYHPNFGPISLIVYATVSEYLTSSICFSCGNCARITARKLAASECSKPSHYVCEK